jgi:thioredoxin 1
MQISHATPENFDSRIGESGLNVFYFWGPDCPNCEVFAKELPELLPMLPASGHLIKVNAYEFPELARRFAIFGIPSFVLFKDGKKLGMMRQYNGKEFFSSVIHEHA